MISAAASNAPAANAAASNAVTSLEPTDGLILVGIVVAGMLLAGLVVIRGRSRVPASPDTPAGSVIRSWIAVSLVMGLLVLSAATFLLDDTTVRSTLLGGLVTSVGGAIAFYFSSKAGDQTQQALAKANQVIAQGGATPPKI